MCNYFHTGSSTRCSVMTGGVGWGGGEEGGEKEIHEYQDIADSLYCTAETKTTLCSKLYSNKSIKEKS